MDPKDKLVKELFGQDFSSDSSENEALRRYMQIAHGYAAMENSIAVLSDMHRNVSLIYSGRFASTVGMEPNLEGFQVASIWEENIFKLIHDEDLKTKHMEELLFFHYIKRVPKKCRQNYYLISRIRMKTPQAGYIPVLHRMFYIPDADNNSLRLALCLYSPLAFELPVKCSAVNSLNGSYEELKREDTVGLLSPREKEVLALIGKGFISKDIAEMLSISKNTVSRHRQEILAKLQVKNSIEACRVAKGLKLI